MRNTRAVWIVLLLLFSMESVLSQPPDTLWTWVHSELYDTQGNDLVEALNGDIVVAGLVDVSLISNAYLAKFTSGGDTVWTRAYRESDSAIVANGVVQALNDRFYFCGTGIHPSSAPVPYVAKIDSDGTVLWHRTFPGSQIGYSITTTHDGGCVFVASGFGPTLLFRLDAMGDTIWTRQHEYSVISDYRHVRQTADGGFILFGSEWDFDLALQLALLKVNSEGDTLWRRRYGGVGSDWRGGFDLCADGGFIMSGMRERLDGSGLWDMVVARADSMGNEQWFRYYGGGREGANAVRALSNGDYIVAGSTTTYGHQGRDIYLLALDSDGDSLWSVAYGWAGSDYALAAKETHDGGLVLTGVSNNAKTGYRNLYVLRTATLTDVGDAGASLAPYAPFHQNYPNPFNSTTQIEFTLPSTQRVTLRLYDVLGREVAVMMNEIQTAGQHRLTFDASGLPSGVYLCRLEAGEMMQTRKMVLVK